MGHGSVFSETWSGCSALTSFAAVATGAGRSFNGTWAGCSALTSFPALDLAQATDLSDAWNGCSGLPSFPLVDTGAVIRFSGSWRNCSHLTSFPLIDTSAGVDFSQAWADCSALTSFPRIATAQGAFFVATWAGCSSMYSIPRLDLSGMIDGTECFHGDFLDPNSYSSLFYDFVGASPHHGVVFDGGAYSTYSPSVATQHDDLITTYGWIIFDAGITPSITSPSRASVHTGAAFAYEFTALGSGLTYACTGLPAWLSFDPLTHLVSGTAPGAVGEATFTALLSSTYGTSNMTVTIYINGTDAPVITADSITASLGLPFSYQISATHTPTHYTQAGLPSGLTLDPDTGRITGMVSLQDILATIIEEAFEE